MYIQTNEQLFEFLHTQIEKIEKIADKLQAMGVDELRELGVDLSNINLHSLRVIDPYNDLFHYSCQNWPNCEDESCGPEE